MRICLVFMDRKWKYWSSSPYTLYWRHIHQYTDQIKSFLLMYLRNNFVTIHLLKCFDREIYLNLQTWSFFWSVFSRIWTECRDLFCKFSYSVRIREIADQKKFRILTFLTQCFKITNYDLVRNLHCICWMLYLQIDGGLFLLVIWNTWAITL